MGSGEVTEPSGILSTSWSCALAIGRRRARLATVRRAVGVAEGRKGKQRRVDVEVACVEGVSVPRRGEDEGDMANGVSEVSRGGGGGRGFVSAAADADAGPRPETCDVWAARQRRGIACAWLVVVVVCGQLPLWPVVRCNCLCTYYETALALG